MTHTTHCALRLGDNLAHLHFLRKLADRYPEWIFVHFAHAEYLEELTHVVSSHPRIALRALPKAIGSRWNARPHVASVDAWKNAGGYFSRTPAEIRNQYGPFMLRWFAELAGRLGLESPLKSVSDLLFDYPELRHEPKSEKRLDFLVVNSAPLSGQARDFNPAELDKLIVELRRLGYSVLATQPSHNGIPFPNTQAWGWSVTQIGRASQAARFIIMVSTGPSWPTFNVWNQTTVELRIIINEPEIVDLDPGAWHASSVPEVRQILKLKGFL